MPASRPAAWSRRRRSEAGLVATAFVLVAALWLLASDEEVLKGAGVTDFARYAVTPGVPLYQDLFVD